MEKLIELLKDYRTEKLRREMYVNGADKEAIELSEAERINEYEVSQTLDSQNYLKSFVKWLVENDKIDINKTPGHYIYHYTDEDVVKEALMHLAISDTPIDLLCSLLK